jgi:hypothetical protein
VVRLVPICPIALFFVRVVLQGFPLAVLLHLALGLEKTLRDSAWKKIGGRPEGDPHE